MKYKRNLLRADSPRFASPDGNGIQLQCCFRECNNGKPISFIATKTDCEAHGRKIYERAMQGDFGVISAYVPPPPVSDDILANQARHKRDFLLQKTDYTQISDAPSRTATVSQWRDYRQRLRDITNQINFPRSIDWPDPPL
jgi:hypothetical protein